jgi:hypothetical protein
VGLGGWEGGDWGVSGGEARGPSWSWRISWGGGGLIEEGGSAT